MTAELSRLDAIRDLFGPRENGGYCECELCVAGRELLAVVDAVLGDTTPKKIAGRRRWHARNTAADESTKAYDLGLAAVWEKLT